MDLSKPHAYRKTLAVFLILVVTFFTFSSAIDNDFTNWDDSFVLVENAHVQFLSFDNVLKIFQNLYVGIYIPLTVLSFTVEHYFFGLDPFVYHLNNVLLHLGVILLIYVFALKIGLSLRAAVAAALLFAVHPMHVESVAWVTQRKDVLYALFYLLAMLSYWQYLQNNNKGSYGWSILWTLLSILAKPMAYSLPLVLFIWDWFAGRKFDKELFLEKIPHILIVGSIGLLTFKAHPHTIAYPFGEALLIWVWSFCFYISKFVLPFGLSPLYVLPEPVSLSNPSYFLSGLALILLLFLVFRFKGNRLFLLANMFYAVSISMIVFRAAWSFGNNTVAADRFMYLPSLGFCLFFGILADELLKRWTAKKLCYYAGYLLLIALFLVFSVKTYRQCNVWQNSLTLWNTVISQNPDQSLAYLNRGSAYVELGRWKKAQGDYDRALSLDSTNPELYLSRAILFLKTNQYEASLKEFEQTLRLEPHYRNAYFHRANLYAMTQQYPLAVEDYRKVLEIDPEYYLAYYNLGFMYEEMGKNEEAISNYTKALAVNPQYTRAYNNRGYLYLAGGRYPLALKDFDMILRLEPDHAEALNNKGVTYFRQNNYEQAFIYFDKAVRVNPNYSEAQKNRMAVYHLLQEKVKSN